MLDNNDEPKFKKENLFSVFVVLLDFTCKVLRCCNIGFGFSVSAVFSFFKLDSVIIFMFSFSISFFAISFFYFEKLIYFNGL